MLEISCAKARAALTSPPELLTAGMAKVVTVHFAFSPDWDGLRKTAVFSDGWRTVDVLEAAWTDGCVPIPHEVLQTAGRNVRVGVYGSDSTGVELPTVWAELGRVRPAADPSGDTSTDPTAPVWSQLQGQIGDLDKLTTTDKSTLVAAINEAAHSGGGGGSAVLYTEQNLTPAQQRQARTNIDVDGYNVINYLWPTEHSGREDTDITTLLENYLYMGIVRNSTAFPSPGLVMLQGPMTGNVYTAVLLAKDGLTYTATFQYVRSTKHVTVLDPVEAASSKLISVKLTPSESGENVYTADRDIGDIDDALQAGHMALAYTPDAAGLQNSVGLITSCVSNFVTVLDCWDTGLASTRWHVDVDGRTWTETAYAEYAESGWVDELARAMPHPVGKTDAMTQAVGMDEKGKLWTQPGAVVADISLSITGATVGQIAKITAVDTNGKPTAWSPVDMAGEKKAWTKIIDVEITEATMSFEVTGLDNVTELYCEWGGLKTASETNKRDFDLYINDIAVGVGWVLNAASNGQAMYGYSISTYNGFVWYNTRSAGIAGASNAHNTSIGNNAKVSYGLVHGVGAARNVKIKAINADNAPVAGKLEVWAR